MFNTLEHTFKPITLPQALLYGCGSTKFHGNNFGIYIKVLGVRAAARVANSWRGVQRLVISSIKGYTARNPQGQA